MQKSLKMQIDKFGKNFLDIARSSTDAKLTYIVHSFHSFVSWLENDKFITKFFHPEKLFHGRVHLI